MVLQGLLGGRVVQRAASMPLGHQYRRRRAVMLSLTFFSAAYSLWVVVVLRIQYLQHLFPRCANVTPDFFTGLFHLYKGLVVNLIILVR